MSDRQGDASFLIHHFLCFYLRGELFGNHLELKRFIRERFSEGFDLILARCRVLFLGLVQTLNHYSSVSQRLVSKRFFYFLNYFVCSV